MILRRERYEGSKIVDFLKKNSEIFSKLEEFKLYIAGGKGY